MAQKTAVKKTKKVAPAKKAAPVAAKKPLPKATPAAPAKSAVAPKGKDSIITTSKKKPAVDKTTVKAAAAPAKPEKPVKVSSGLNKADLSYFRNLLLEKRREILGDVGSMESEAFKTGSNLSNMPIHMADVGTDNFEQEFTLGLIESERQMLREIQDALARIDEGSFGVCKATGKVIGRVRLEAVPWAKFCMEYQKALESGKIRNEVDNDDDGNDSSDDDED